MIKRLFDIACSLAGLLLLSPLLCLISLLIVFDSGGGMFYRQLRVGKGGVDFLLYKFRTMRPGSDAKSLLTVGSRDKRITRIGYFLRKYKLDELPQLINVLKGDMSLVGPRPEVRKYVNLYNEEQKRVLAVRPGLTDYASIEYASESDLLARCPDPEKTYVDEIMPAKLRLNLQYIHEQGILTDVKIVFKTIQRILLHNKSA